MSNVIPDNAQDALAQGWLFVCIVPPTGTKGYAHDLPHIERLSAYAETFAFAPYSRLNKPVPDNSLALWVKGYKWPEGLHALLFGLYMFPMSVDFCKKVICSHIPGFVFDRRRKLADVLNEINTELSKTVTNT